MSKETTPSEETKKDELRPHDEIQASVKDQGKVSEDENQVPNEEAAKATSDEDPEALADNKEAKVEANDEITNENPQEQESAGKSEGATDAERPLEPLASDEPEKLAEEIMADANDEGEDDNIESAEAGDETKDKPLEPSAEIPGDKEVSSDQVKETTPQDGDIKPGEIREQVAEDAATEETTPEMVQIAPDKDGGTESGEEIEDQLPVPGVEETVVEETTADATLPETDEINKTYDQEQGGQNMIDVSKEVEEDTGKDENITTEQEPDPEKPDHEITSKASEEVEISAESTEKEVDQIQDKAQGEGTKDKALTEEEVHISDVDNIHDDGDELVHADYSQYSKEELVGTIKKLTKIEDFKKLDLVLNIIDPLFQNIKQADREAALQKYIAEGGGEEDFAYKNELDQRYDAYYKLIKERKNKFYGDLGRRKLENYQKATELLEKLRHLVDGEESTTSINAIKEIQEEWKAIGQVPPQHVRNLWASYNALMDRFYDNRSIYFELKELDRRKNLTAKEELCVRAEKLEEVANLKDAIKELNELHNEYKHIGPVPKAQQEALWQRFKAASDKVYARRKTYYDDLKKDLEVNLEAKAKLRDEVQPFVEFDSDRIVEWNKKTQEILDIQKRWEAIGGLPRDRAPEVNKPFWSAFKRFFNNKNGFFKKLEGQREGNLKLKEELVAKANELKDSTDWNQTATELKKLQNDWRNIGPVPEKHRNEVYQRFKKACDFFFENRRNRFKEVEKEYDKNLKLKEDVCQRILKLAEEGAGDIGQLEALQEEWNSIGFVPKNAIRSSQEMFAKAVDEFIASSSLDDDEKNKLKITTKLTSLKGTPNANRKLNKKEFTLRRQITNLENDISLWKNNLEFFANSKNADQVRQEFDEKIENAKKQLQELKAQLKIIRDI